MKKWIEIAFLSVLVTLFFAPLLLMLVPNGYANKFKLDERRELNRIENPYSRWLHMDPKLSEEVKGYFDDRYGFRDLLVRLKNEIGYQFFRTSEKVYIGPNGWLFDKSYIQAVLRDANDTAIDERILTQLRILKNYLAKRNITLVLVINPTKSTIYPQYLEPGILSNVRPRLLQRLREHLNHEPGLIFIDSEIILREHKKESVFYKTDIHLSPKGEFYVFSDMVRKIALASKMPLPPPLETFKWKFHYWNYGSEERYLAKFIELGEMNNFPDSHYIGYKTDQFETWTFDVGNGTISNGQKFPLFDWVCENKRQNVQLLPPIMIFGTSYSDGFFGLRYHEAFKKVYRTKSTIPDRILPVIRNLPSDIKYFVVEYPEVMLPNIQYFSDGSVKHPA